jgi:hypothetical protein
MGNGGREGRQHDQAALVQVAHLAVHVVDPGAHPQVVEDDVVRGPATSALRQLGADQSLRNAIVEDAHRTPKRRENSGASVTLQIGVMVSIIHRVFDWHRPDVVLAMDPWHG